MQMPLGGLGSKDWEGVVRSLVTGRVVWDEKRGEMFCGAKTFKLPNL